MVVLLSFFISVLAILLPVGVCLGLSPKLRLRWNIAFPLGVVLGAGFEALFAAWLHKVLPFGFLKWGLTVSLATLFTGGTLHWTIKTVSNAVLSRTVFRKIWLPLVLIGALFCIENLVILGRQGWDTGPGGTPYFRPPFQNDGQRHVILVNALLRGGDAPFLPGEKLTYQLFWYHWTALSAGLFQVKTLYPVVQGAIGATSLLFIFCFLWSLTRLYPLPFARGGRLLLVPLIALWNSDVYNFLTALIFLKRPGIEADWSSISTYFRYFSIKLVTLTAPQHAFFFLFLAMLLGIRHARSGREVTKIEFTFIEWLLIFFCWLSSPVMSLFFFPMYALAEIWRLRRQWQSLGVAAISFLGAIIVINFIYPSLFGFDFISLFLRPGNPPLEWGAGIRELLFFPVLWINIAGVLGGIAIAVLIIGFRSERAKRKIISWESSVFFLGAPLFYYLATGIEIRRHFSMIAGFAGTYFLMRLIPTNRAWRNSWQWNWGAAASGCLALGLHLYFLYCYLGKPSHLSAQYDWGDYFDMNQIVRKKFPELSILSAIDNVNLGLDYPIVMEATTSFSATYHTAVHVKLSPEKMKVLTAMEFSGEVVPFGARLGYRGILWGPVEERVWGDKVKKRFMAEQDKLATTGRVSLYRLSDNLKDYFLQETAKGGDNSYRIAKKLLQDGWNGEALDYFQSVLNENPNFAAGYFGIGQVFQRIGKYLLALDYFTRTVQIDPNFAEAAFQAGIIFRGIGRMDEAEKAFLWAIEHRPGDALAYRELAALLFWEKRFSLAERVLKKAIEKTNEKRELGLLLSEVIEAQSIEGKL